MLCNMLKNFLVFFCSFKYILMFCGSLKQGDITCGAIEAASRSSKAIDDRVFINFCDKNVVTTGFRDKNDVFDFNGKMS